MKQQQISSQSDATIDCRQQQLQVIYRYTHEDYKGHASDRWPRQHHDKPTLFVLEGGITTLKLLEDLTDEQIQEKLPGCLYMRAVDLVRKELLGNLGWQACEGPDLAMKQIETSDGGKEVYAMIRKFSTTQVALALFCSKSDRNCLDSKSLLLPRFASRQRFAELVAAFVADLDEDVSELFAETSSLGSILLSLIFRELLVRPKRLHRKAFMVSPSDRKTLTGLRYDQLLTSRTIVFPLWGLIPHWGILGPLFSGGVPC